MSLDKNNQDAFEEGQFEEHLKRFRPVIPRTLFVPRHSAASMRWPILAAAVVVVVAIALVIAPKFSMNQRTTPPRSSVGLSSEARAPLTLGRLNLALRTGNQNLENMLRVASPELLPHEHQGTALYELSKE